MRTTLITILVLLLHTISLSQDSIVVKNIRETKPFFSLVDINGFGVGYSIHKNIDIHATTMLMWSGANVKVYLSEKNSAPFVGLGAGKLFGGFGGNGDNNNWTVALAGWQYHPFPSKGVFFAVMYQYAILNENSRAKLPSMFSFNIGIRLL